MSVNADTRRCGMWLRPRGRDALTQALSACRKSAGLTQEQLAHRLHVNRTTVIDMEAGRNQAVARAVEALSVLGYDLVVVPRNASVTVTEPTVTDPAAPTPQAMA
jgi:DNA-binding XRE family transcriptional regulator